MTHTTSKSPLNIYKYTGYLRYAGIFQYLQWRLQRFTFCSYTNTHAHALTWTQTHTQRLRLANACAVCPIRSDYYSMCTCCAHAYRRVAKMLLLTYMLICTKSFLESIYCRTHLLEISGYPGSLIVVQI